MIVQRAGDVIPQIVGPAGAARAGDEAVPDADALPALRHADREARGRGDAPLPEPGVPLARARDADQLGAGARPTSRASASSSSAGSGSSGSCARCPELYRLTKEQLLELDGFGEISRRNAIDAIEASKADPVPARPLRAQHPRRRLGDGAEPRAPLRHRSTRCSTATPGGARRVRGHRPRARRGDRRVVRRRGQPPARRGAARRSGCSFEADEERPAGRGPAHRARST